MRSSEFRYLNRGQKQVLVLIPGWGFDCRIFGELNLKYNYLLPVELVLSSFKYDLRKVLKKRSINGVSLLGWSLGAFLAADFVSEFPHLVKELYLVGVRRRYTQDEIADMESFLKKDRKERLYKFYRECFSPDRKGFLWFKRNLLKAYLEEMDLGSLLEGLDYLAGAKLKKRLLLGKRVKFLHGRQDKIAPLEEALSFCDQLPDARLTVVEEAGHVPFLLPAFEEWIKR